MENTKNKNEGWPYLPFPTCEKEEALFREAYWEWRRNQPTIKIKKEDRIYGCGIYIISWKTSERFYIGKSKNMNNRLSRHLTGFRNGGCENELLFFTYLEHGIPEFKVIKHCEESDLDKLELEELSKHISNPNLLNIVIPKKYIFINESSH